MSRAEDELLERVVELAREWIGTPFHHAGRVKGQGGGIDCIGIVAAPWAAAGVHVQEAQVGHYRSRINGQELVDAMGVAFERVQGDDVAEVRSSIDLADLRKADALVFGMGRKYRPHHVALVSRVDPCAWIIHAHQSRNVVQEHELHLGEWVERIHSVYRVRRA